MEREREGKKKHRCKVCRKWFPSGRSLGGHMRSHVTVSSSVINGDGDGDGYGLRENPKRTWRFCDSSIREEEEEEEEEEPSEKQCRECGKCFPSWQALFGHLRCHSDNNNNNKQLNASENEDLDLDLAITLMMLSRDTGRNWDLDLERSKAEIFVSGIDEGLRKAGAFNGNGKKSFYECSTCKKNFHSYQALGGHRASHKRLRMDAIAIDGTVMPELLDLNLPAVVAPPIAGDSSLKSSWWNCEPMVELI